MGGSMAGLLAARVLPDHFARVTVVERDRLPAGPELRSGVPQARHVHVLLVRGQQILERRFPGPQAELAGAGAPTVNWTQDWAFFGLGRWSPGYPSGPRDAADGGGCRRAPGLYRGGASAAPAGESLRTAHRGRCATPGAAPRGVP